MKTMVELVEEFNQTDGRVGVEFGPRKANFKPYF